MGIKQKWRDESDVHLIEIFDKMSEIMSPLFNNKGQVNVASFAKKMSGIFTCVFIQY